MRRPRVGRPSRITLGILTLVAGALIVEAIRTAPVRDALRVFTRLVDAGNRGDLATVRSLCSSRYLRAHPPRLAAEGGMVGPPRRIHPNFLAWRHGPDVWVCPTDRQQARPVFQLIREGDGWRFDGPVGVLLVGNAFVPRPSGGDPDEADEPPDASR